MPDRVSCTRWTPRRPMSTTRPRPVPCFTARREGGVRRCRVSARRASPAAGGETGVAGIWLTHRPTQTQAPIAADFCAVTPSLRFSHWVGATIHRCTLNDRRRSACRRCAEWRSQRRGRRLPAPRRDALSPETEIVVSAGFATVAGPNAALAVCPTAPSALRRRWLRRGRDWPRRPPPDRRSGGW
jgi:hypothetical protein